MVSDMLFRVACNGGGEESLGQHLKRITDAAYTRKNIGGVAVAGELLAPVVAESHDADCRREIMKHIRECLSESSGKRWQKIFGGLVLTEELMKNGSPHLVIECAQGHHFDLVQKVCFLEKFDAAAHGCSDRRAQQVIRLKASELLQQLVPQLRQASTEDLPMNAGLGIKDNLSTCSATSNTTPSTAAIGSASCSSSMATTGSIVSSDSVEVDFDGDETCEIDDAFASLRQWMESTESWASGSCPRESSGEGSFDDPDADDWEPIGELPIATEKYTARQRSVSSDDIFFTPMPTPALPMASSRPISQVLSL
jgi:hypothetical protein|mmetsp:Transcript_82292/g.129592  ORF Transcript_82292/g.129592 Transcript_82292/m.129592 type:complete len:311 (-) Transcript_82292:72-1004(-)